MSRRPYIRELSKTGWWLKQPRYIRYMAREMSALFIGIYVLVLIAGIVSVVAGRSRPMKHFARAQKGPSD